MTTTTCPNCDRLQKSCFHCRQTQTWGTNITPHDANGDYINGDLDGPAWGTRFEERISKIIGHEPAQGDGWADHRYQEKDKDGHTVFVSHPYMLRDKDMRELLALADAGYKITITGASAYFPGRTMRIEVRYPKGVRD